MSSAALKFVETTKPKAKATAKPKAKPAPENDHLLEWSNGGVVGLVILSASLNGYANSQHASVVWAGWVMGVVIPIIVLVLAKVAGKQWKRGQLARAKVTGGTGVGLLALSVWHCAQSIALLTAGSVTPWSMVLALPMAVAIDCGLVCCEVGSLDA